METSLRAAQKAFTRSKLITAARDVFEEKGYLNSSIDDITTRAGATRATLYLHFSSKAEVATAVWEREVEEPTAELWKTLKLVLVNQGLTESSLKNHWFPAVLEHYEERGTVIQEIWQAGVIEPGVKEKLNQASEHVRDLLVAALEDETRFTKTELRVRAAGAFALQSYLFIALIEDRAEFTKQELVDALTDAWMALLQ